MQRHHEKRRDMARSILPSKNGEAARAALTSTKRAHRRAITQELTGLIGAPRRDGYEPNSYEEWDERHAVGRVADAQIRALVSRRRGGDKLNHFMRWAVAVTAELPVEDRLPQLRAMLPEGLVGRHAMSHLQYEPGLREPQDHDRRYLEQVQVGWAARRRDRRRAEREAALEVIRGLLRDVVDTGGELARFNRIMKTCDLHADRDRCAAEGCVRRCLGGAHDIDAFVEEIAAIPVWPPRQWSIPEGPAGLPVRRLAHWLTGLRIVGGSAPGHVRAPFR